MDAAVEPWLAARHLIHTAVSEAALKFGSEAWLRAAGPGEPRHIATKARVDINAAFAACAQQPAELRRLAHDADTLVPAFLYCAGKSRLSGKELLADPRWTRELAPGARPHAWHTGRLHPMLFHAALLTDLTANAERPPVLARLFGRNKVPPDTLRLVVVLERFWLFRFKPLHAISELTALFTKGKEKPPLRLVPVLGGIVLGSLLGIWGDPRTVPLTGFRERAIVYRELVFAVQPHDGFGAWCKANPQLVATALGEFLVHALTGTAAAEQQGEHWQSFADFVIECGNALRVCVGTALKGGETSWPVVLAAARWAPPSRIWTRLARTVPPPPRHGFFAAIAHGQTSRPLSPQRAVIRDIVARCHGRREPSLQLVVAALKLSPEDAAAVGDAQALYETRKPIGRAADLLAARLSAPGRVAVSDLCHEVLLAATVVVLPQSPAFTRQIRWRLGELLGIGEGEALPAAATLVGVCPTCYEVKSDALGCDLLLPQRSRVPKKNGRMPPAMRHFIGLDSVLYDPELDDLCCARKTGRGAAPEDGDDSALEISPNKPLRCPDTPIMTVDITESILRVGRVMLTACTSCGHVTRFCSSLVIGGQQLCMQCAAAFEVWQAASTGGKEGGAGRCFRCRGRTTDDDKGRVEIFQTRPTALITTVALHDACTPRWLAALMARVVKDGGQAMPVPAEWLRQTLEATTNTKLVLDPRTRSISVDYRTSVRASAD